MIIYDKASWHIDAGMNEEEVINKLKILFDFLASKDMLSDEGKEEYECGIDDSCSLNERTVNSQGNEFLGHYYDEIINYDDSNILNYLSELYEVFLKL